MTRSALPVGMFVLAACEAFGQSPAPAFDVASIRPSQGGRAEGGRRESIQLSPDGVTMRNVSLRSCIRWAYHIIDVQVNGPEWIASERFDIAAKAAAPVPEVAPSDSHGCVFDTVQFKVPPPLLAIEIVWPAGLTPPAVALNESELADTETPGTGAAATVNVTATVFAAGFAPAAEIVIVSV